MTEPDVNTTPSRDDDYLTIRNASMFALGPTGYAAQIIPATHAIFRLVVDTESTSLLLQLVESDNPVARVYGLYGLFHRDRTLFEQTAAPFRNDTTPVLYLMGCNGLQIPLNQLIHSWEVSVDAPPRRKNFWQRLNGLFSSAK